MRAKEVLKLLQISQPTLGDYVKKGYIKCDILPTGRREYDEDSVYQFLNRDIPRKLIYICTSFFQHLEKGPRKSKESITELLLN